MKTRTIRVDALARVEGEGSLLVRVKGGRVADVQLKIFEPPRYFEGILRGRHPSEAPDITARICGICPVAYQMSAVHAMERAFGAQIPPPVRALRRLLYCGEWIQSHALHIYMLHAPDFLGYPSAVHMARDHAAIVQRGLELKKVGNAILALVGGREIHPINVRLGGFYRAPRPADVAAVAEPLRRAADLAEETVRWAAGFEFPELERDYELVALSHPDEYPMNEGRIVSNRGLDIGAGEYEAHFEERQVPHSTALHSAIRGRGAYLVGPLARYSLNADRLTPRARDAARGAGLGAVCVNPFRSIVVRAVETLYACEEALRLVEAYEPPEPPAAPVAVRAGVGAAATEAPRGLLYHRYRIGDDGLIAEATIVPPTSQNQPTIEEDLRVLVPRVLDLPEAELTHRCEQAIRNFDPCISCATHFLKLRLERE
jgi:coenzyme F420-reducing hydrogenase alpha subunit